MEGHDAAQAQELLNAVLAGSDVGATVQEPSGRVIYANAAAAAIIGFDSAADLIAASGPEVTARFEVFYPDGTPFPPELLPARAALRGESPPEVSIRFRQRGSTHLRWTLLRSVPTWRPDGSVRYAINFLREVTEAVRRDEQRAFLLRAVDALNSSLDYEQTLATITRMAVPALADWCAVDLTRADALHRVAVAHVDPAKLALVTEIERRYPSDPHAATGVPQVIRSGRAEFVPDIPYELIERAAIDEEHLRLVSSLQLRSYLGVPLTVRGVTIGAITFAMAESGRRYTDMDLEFAEGLAARAALAIDNARLVRELERANAATQELLAQAEGARITLASAEAELRFIIESIPVQVWTADPTGQLTYVSDRVVAYFESTAAEILGSGWLAVLHPDDVDLCVARWSHSLTTGEPYEVEFRLRRGDGEYRWHLGRAAAQRGDDGAVLRWFGTNTDMHEAKLAIAELRARSEYEQRLIGIVSHDLRNPLNAVALGATLLASRGLDEVAARTVARMTRSAERATRLIRDLLDFAKARIGTTIPINPGPANLREIVEQVADEFQMGAPTRHVRVEHLGDESGRWDADRIAQVLSNLLGNALQHAPAEALIRIESRIDGADAVVAVINSGPPIPSTELPRLFEPFKRGHNATTTGGSLGLGLYIAREVVVAHGGTIDVVSNLVETRFTVRLPRFVEVVSS